VNFKEHKAFNQRRSQGIKLQNGINAVVKKCLLLLTEKEQYPEIEISMFGSRQE